MTPPVRYGAAQLADLCRALESAGYDGIWSGEVNNVDSVAPTAVAAAVTARTEVAAMLNVFTRAPSTLAMTAATLADLAPGRAAVILGVASPLLVQRFNGIPYDRPLARLRDVTAFLRQALGGGRVRGEFDTFTTGGFGLSAPPAVPPTIYIASSGPASMAFAAKSADAVIVNWLTEHDLDRLPELPADRSRVVLQFMVCPTADAEERDATVRGLVADYLCAPGYAGLQRRLGRAGALVPMWESFARGDRAGAHRALPAEVLDALVVSGTPAECRRRIDAAAAATGARIAVAIFAPAGRTFADAARF